MARHRVYCWNYRLRRMAPCGHTRVRRGKRETQDTPVGVTLKRYRAGIDQRVPKASVKKVPYRGSRYQKREPYRQKGRGRSLRWHGPAYTPGRPLGPSRLPFRLPVFR